MKQLIILLLAQLTYGQISVSGRTSVTNLTLDYDNKSAIGIDSSAYSTSSLIPGNTQLINVAIFLQGEENSFNIISDISKNEWKGMSYNDLQRLSIEIQYQELSAVIGDYFQSSNQFFMQNREVRGFKSGISFKNPFNEYYSNISIGYGQVQRFRSLNEKVYDRYESYYSSTELQRLLFFTEMNMAVFEEMNTNLYFLTGKDKDDFSDENINPYKNTVFGASTELRLLENKLQLGAEFFLTKRDTVFENRENGNSSDNHYSISAKYYSSNVNFKIEKYKHGNKYHSFGNPFLEIDKDGFKTEVSYLMPSVFYTSVQGNFYNNLPLNDSVFDIRSRFIQFEIGTQLNSAFNVNASFNFQNDKSQNLADEFVDKNTFGLNLSLSLTYENQRYTLSGSYSKINDKSIFESGAALGSTQNSISVNFYNNLIEKLEASGGSVYTKYSSEDDAASNSLFLYLTSKYSIIPQQLRAEFNLNTTFSDGSAAKLTEDQIALGDIYSNELSNYLNQFNQIEASFALEYFFSYDISAKLTAGIENKKFKYLQNLSQAEILSRLNSVGDYTFFDKNEDYKAKRISLELNILF